MKNKQVRCMLVNNLAFFSYNFTKKELDTIDSIFANSLIDCNNILNHKFKDVTPNFNYSSRSKFKSKLIKTKIIIEHNKKIMFNPYAFIDNHSDIEYHQDGFGYDSQLPSREVWKYITGEPRSEDFTIEQVKELVNDMFGKLPIREQLRTKVSNKKISNHNKLVDLHQSNR